MELPLINQRYNSFNDGAVHIIKLYTTTITEIISFDDFNKGLPVFDIWISFIDEYHWLYKQKTDYFITAIDEDGDSEIYVQGINNSWISIDGSILDIDGSLYNSIKEEKELDEQNYIKFLNSNCINNK